MSWSRMCVFAVHWMVYVGASAGVTMTTAWCEVLVPIRCITHGEGHFWFGYYDKLQFDPTGRFVLGMKVDFEHRSPTRNDVVEVGLVDLDDGARWTRLGESCAWNWQQGCMLQWLPGSAHHVVWNDREADRFVCRILDIETGELRTVDAPVYSISPDGTSAVLPDFRRLNACRPGYSARRCRHLEGESSDRADRTDPLAGRGCGHTACCRILGRGQALVQPPPLESERYPLRLPAPMAGRRRRLGFLHADGHGAAFG